MLRSLFVFLILSLFLPPARADVWVPPWGEPVYDSTFIAITASEDEVLVDVRAHIGVVKLLNDDYILTWVRDLNHGLPYGDPVLRVSDSLCHCNWNDGRLDARFLSHLSVEDTLHVEVHTVHRYPPDEDGDLLRRLDYCQIYRRTSDDPLFMHWAVGMPPYDRLPSYSRITANTDLEVCDWEANDRIWGQPQQGRDFIVSHEGEMIHYWDYFAHRIYLLGMEGVIDTLSDNLTYEITPELREAVPNLILEEEVSIQLTMGYMDEEIYGYNLFADIRLEPDLAREISPMWLWFPNDQTQDIATDLVGLRASGSWGSYPERWVEDTLEIRQGNIRGQEGFYIHVPWLENPVETPNEVWWWSDPRLRVEVHERWQGVDSCRFILITAPLDPSSVRFTIPNEFGFIRWTSPFDQVRFDDRPGLGTSLTFCGICREPGIALVQWGEPGAATPEGAVPTDFAIQALHPNPFNSRATLTYRLPQSGSVWLDVYDARGGIVAWQSDYAPQAGEQTLTLNASALPAGVYLLRLEAAGQIRTTKAVCVK